MFVFINKCVYLLNNSDKCVFYVVLCGVEVRGFGFVTFKLRIVYL